MVEAVANGVEDKLVDGLSFKLAPGASYVQDRRSVTFHPQGSNIYSPVQGTRMIKFLLSGDNWMDPSTFRIAFDLKTWERQIRDYDHSVDPILFLNGFVSLLVVKF